MPAGKCSRFLKVPAQNETWRARRPDWKSAGTRTRPKPVMKNVAMTLAGKLSLFYHAARRPKAREKPKSGKPPPKTDLAGKWMKPKPRHFDGICPSRRNPAKRETPKPKNTGGRAPPKGEKAQKRTASATAGKPTPPKRTLPKQQRRACHLRGRKLTQPATNNGFSKCQKTN